MTERAGARGRPFVVAAPSGTGKTTVCRALLERDPRLRFSVSHTTRKPRENERDGIDYHFVDNERFRELVTSDAFLEYAEYGDNLYGTSWEALESPIAEGWDLTYRSPSDVINELLAKPSEPDSAPSIIMDVSRNCPTESPPWGLLSDINMVSCSSKKGSLRILMVIDFPPSSPSAQVII
ncbi:MAG: hypothetical protein VCC20_05015, partial [Myxococcota bacterium]